MGGSGTDAGEAGAKAGSRGRNTSQRAYDQAKDPTSVDGGEKHWHVLKTSMTVHISILI